MILQNLHESKILTTDWKTYADKGEQVARQVKA